MPSQTAAGETTGYAAAWMPGQDRVTRAVAARDHLDPCRWIG
jgi:hypothetical protein